MWHKGEWLGLLYILSRPSTELLNVEISPSVLAPPSSPEVAPQIPKLLSNRWQPQPSIWSLSCQSWGAESDDGRVKLSVRTKLSVSAQHSGGDSRRRLGPLVLITSPLLTWLSRCSDFSPLLLCLHFLPPWCSSALSGKNS